MESVLNYLSDDIERNLERLNLFKDFLKKNPLKSIQEKNVNGNIYYYLVFRNNKKIIQKYIGDKKKIVSNNELNKLNEYNDNVKDVKERYSKLKEENRKFIKIFNFANKVYYEKN